MEMNQNLVSTIPTIFSVDNGVNITNLNDAANTFKNYFAAIADTAKKYMKQLNKHFSDLGMSLIIQY